MSLSLGLLISIVQPHHIVFGLLLLIIAGFVFINYKVLLYSYLIFYPLANYTQSGIDFGFGDFTLGGYFNLFLIFSFLIRFLIDTKFRGLLFFLIARDEKISKIYLLYLSFCAITLTWTPTFFKSAITILNMLSYLIVYWFALILLIKKDVSNDSLIFTLFIMFLVSTLPALYDILFETSKFYSKIQYLNEADLFRRDQLIRTGGHISMTQVGFLSSIIIAYCINLLQNVRDKKRFLFLSCLACYSLFILLNTFTRSAWGATGLAILITSFFFLEKRTFIVGCFLGLGLVSVLPFITKRLDYDRIIIDLSYRAYDLWIPMLERLFSEGIFTVLVGKGYFSFMYYGSIFIHKASMAHNFLVTNIFETGILGFGLFLYFLKKSIDVSLKLLKPAESAPDDKSQRVYGSILLCIIVGLTFEGMFENIFYGNIEVPYFFVTLAVCVFCLKNTLNKKVTLV